VYKNLARWISSITFALLLGGTFRAAHSHESWIEPERFRVSEGALILAAIRVGEGFKGTSFPYIPAEYDRLTISDSSAPARSIVGRLGDLPAISTRPVRNGLHVLAHASRPARLTYGSFEKFRQFLISEGLEWVVSAHHQRRLPPQGFTERFRRFDKSLVEVGEGAGGDRALGMRLELVALVNPYRGKPNQMPVRLLFEGTPVADAQISVFHRSNASDRGTRIRLRSDQRGEARIVRPLAGRYLVSAVHMVMPIAERDGAVWESLWASLTFEVGSPEP